MPDMGDMGGLQIYLKPFLMALADKIHRRKNSKKRSSTGDDLRYDLNVDFKDAIFGQQEKLKFLILRHVMSVGVQVPKQEPDQKLVQHVEEVDRLEELREHLSVISHK